MCAEVLRDCGNQIRRSRITFPPLRLSIPGKRLACFTIFFLLAANTSLERENSTSWRILKGSFNSSRRRCMLRRILERLSGSYSPPFCLRTEKFGQELVESFSKYVVHFKCSFTLLLTEFFPLVSRLLYGVDSLFSSDEIF